MYSEITFNQNQYQKFSDLIENSYFQPDGYEPFIFQKVKTKVYSSVDNDNLLYYTNSIIIDDKNETVPFAMNPLAMVKIQDTKGE